MSDRRPGLDVEVLFDPEKYEGKAIPEAVVADLMDWLAERDLFGSCNVIEYDEQGERKSPRPIDLLYKKWSVQEERLHALEKMVEAAKDAVIPTEYMMGFIKVIKETKDVELIMGLSDLGRKMRILTEALIHLNSIEK